MIRNNFLALLIHTILGFGFYLSGELFYKTATVTSVLVSLLVFYLLYFVLALLFTRLRVFNRRCKSLYHVLLPSLAMSAVLITLYLFDFRSGSFIFGALVGLLGQPAEFILAVTGDKLQQWHSVVGVGVLCVMPTLITWFGLVAGSKNKLDKI
jgi:hypothetical protein